MVDFTRSSGKNFKYHSKKGKFCYLGPLFEVWAPLKITPLPPLYGFVLGLLEPPKELTQKSQEASIL
jgi:hypothetical protein